MIGRVEIEGARTPITRRRVKELVALLALHPHGLNEAQIKNALWLDEMPTTNAFNQAMSRARTSLGTDDNGDLYVPYVFDGVYRPGPSLMTDWHLVESAWELGAGANRYRTTSLTWQLRSRKCAGFRSKEPRDMSGPTNRASLNASAP